MFSFVDCGFNVVSKKIVLDPQRFAVLSSKSFTVLVPVFRTLINFEVIFNVWCEVGLEFHSFVPGCLFVPANLFRPLSKAWFFPLMYYCGTISIVVKVG